MKDLIAGTSTVAVMGKIACDRTACMTIRVDLGGTIINLVGTDHIVHIRIASSNTIALEGKTVKIRNVGWNMTTRVVFIVVLLRQYIISHIFYRLHCIHNLHTHRLFTDLSTAKVRPSLSRRIQLAQ